MNIVDWLGEENKLGIDIWKKKYQKNNESFDAWLDRVSGKNPDIKRLITEKKFLFAGRILSNRGIDRKGLTYSNCYVLDVKDSIEGIFNTCSKMARTYSYGGGVGVDISSLRPSGALVHNAARFTSGAVSFMKTFDTVTEVIGQQGRRAALMCSIDVNHPDVEEFVDVKANTDNITFANISIRVNDKFMQAVENDEDYLLKWPCTMDINEENTKKLLDSIDKYDSLYTEDGFHYFKKIKAKKLFEKLAKNNWDYAEPGILYWDRIKSWHMMSENPEFHYGGVNPCGEEPLPVNGACLLCAMNIEAYVKDDCTFDFNEFAKDVKIATIGINEVLDEGIERHPLQEQRDIAEKYKQVGIGMFNLGGALIRMKIKYGDTKAIRFSSKLTHTMLIAAFEQSCELNKENVKYDKMFDSAFYKEKVYPFIDKKYRGKYPRNSQLLTIAPTGTISTMLNASSGGCEPVFMFEYYRTTKSLHNEDVTYKVYPQIVLDYFNNENIDITKLPDYFVSAEDVKWADRVAMQAALNSNIDASISSTVNLPENTTVDDVYNLYMYAWKMGLKGITIFRSNCKRIAILSKTEKQDKQIISTVDAPKRPKQLNADFYLTKAYGEQFIVLVGLYEGKPYEIFTFRPKQQLNIQNHHGVITKKSKMHYSFDSEYLHIEDLQEANISVEENASTLYTSQLLRHGVPIKHILHTAKKVNANIVSFSSAMCRILAKYMEPSTSKEKCPECGKQSLINDGGCKHCENCGYSQCS